MPTRLLALTLLLIALPLGAHHSYAMFDMQQSITLEGTVKQLEWTNPHIWVQFLVKNPTGGQEVEWSLEGNSPNMLIRAGWNRHALKVGDKATIVVHPVKGASGHSASIAAVTVNGQNVYGGRVGTTPVEESK